MKEIDDLFENFEINLTNRGMPADECYSLLTNNRILIYGAGNAGIVLYERMQKLGFEIQGFLDNRGSIYGERYKTLPIYSNKEAVGILDQAESWLIIVALFDIVSYPTIKEQLLNQFDKFVNLSVYYFAEFRSCRDLFSLQILPRFSVYLGEEVEKLLKNREYILEVYNLLTDELSKRTYLELLNFYMASCEAPHTIFPYEEHYFAYDLYKKDEDEVFVDCGAYDGDTLDFFIHNQTDFKRYIAIEADKMNFEKLQNKSESRGWNDKIMCINAFLSDKKDTVCFSSRGTSFSGNDFTEEGQNVETCTLDELVYEYAPTFIKINLEGADLDAVRGGERTIREYAPLLAIQGHHRMEHLWEIVETIQNYLKGQYKFYLRNYKGISEFTFYAIPKGRTKDE